MMSATVRRDGVASIARFRHARLRVVRIKFASRLIRVHASLDMAALIVIRLCVYKHVTTVADVQHPTPVRVLLVGSIRTARPLCARRPAPMVAIAQHRIPVHAQPSGRAQIAAFQCVSRPARIKAFVWLPTLASALLSILIMTAPYPYATRGSSSQTQMTIAIICTRQICERGRRSKTVTFPSGVMQPRSLSATSCR